MTFLFSSRGILISSLLSGVLLSLAWPSSGFAPLLFVALVPLFHAAFAFDQQSVRPKKRKVFFTFYLTFFTFNILTTWWVKYASLFGAVAAIVCNALFMTIVFYCYYRARQRTGNAAGYFFLVSAWVAFEYIHMIWDLSWPWLTLGNGFAGWLRMIQWYEFTGVLGGTVWIWVVNILFFEIIRNRFLVRGNSVQKNRLITVAAIILVPVFYSWIRYATYTEKSDPVNVAVIQPNIDPYNEKFSGMSSAQQLERIISLASKVTDSTTEYIVAPETALPDGIWEEELDHHPQIRLLKRFQSDFPESKWIIGVASNLYYPDSNLRSATARKFTQSPGYYDSFNTAVQIENDGHLQLHHKSKLVPGVEKMPFPAIFKHLDAFAIDLGGISGSLGMQDVPSVFNNKQNDKIVAPVICYESIYGDYLSKYIRQGATLIFIITNDGWWSDTPGYRQHLKYGTLRAIEMRRSIARSANTGISCFINQRGDIIQPTKWWTPDAIKGTINANSGMTLYARTGDLLGKLASALTILFLARLIFYRKRNSTHEVLPNEIIK